MQNNSVPKITLIIAVYNAADTLEACLKSYVEQTYANKELIIIDNESQDGTASIIEKFKTSIDYFQSEKDTGIYNAWNKGVKKATGDWICFLGADDYLWRPNVFEKLALHLQNGYPKYRVLYGSIALLNPPNTFLKASGQSWEKTKTQMRTSMVLPHPGLMHHKTLFSDHGLFDETFKICGDHEFLLRELLNNEAKYISDLIVAGVRIGGVSGRYSSSVRVFNENNAAHKIHNVKTGLVSYFKRAFKAYARVTVSRLIGNDRAQNMTISIRKLLGANSQ